MSWNNSSNYVPDDGYTEQAFIKAQQGLHGDLRFSYRPFLVEQRSKLLREMEAMPQEKQDAVVAKAMVERLASWDLKGKADNALYVSLDLVRRLKATLFYRLWAVLLGTDPGDLDPQWDDEKTTDLLESELDAADGPAPIGATRELNAEKNSDAG